MNQDISASDGRSERGAATKERIIATATREFANRGYAATALSDIVKKADVTTGAIYHHFGDKKGLFREVAESVERQILQHVTSLPAPEDPWDRFTASIDGALDICTQPGIAQIVFRDAPSVIGQSEWRAIEVQYALGTVLGMISDLADAGRIRAPVPELTAQIILGAIIEAANAIAASPDSAEALKEAKSTVLMMVKSLEATKPKSRKRPGR